LPTDGAERALIQGEDHQGVGHREQQCAVLPG
jgi:hypothetical protein